MGENTKALTKEAAKRRLWKDFEKAGSNDLVPNKAGYNKMKQIFDKTVGHAIDNYDEGEWTRKEARKFVRRHVRLIARVAKRLAEAAKRDYVSPQDIQDAADLVIKRAKVSCNKMLTKPEYKLFGRPCAGYRA